MSIRIDGDIDFQLWYYEKYHTISPIVPFEVYGEYLMYRDELRKDTLKFLLVCACIIFVIGCLFIILF